VHRRARIAALVASTVAALSGTVVAAGSAHADYSIPSGPIRIVNYGSGKCVEPAPEIGTGNFFVNGLPIWQRTCDGAPQQRWHLEPAGYGPVGRYGNFPRYHIVDEYSGQCLDLRDGRTNDGAPLQQWSCNGSSTTMMWAVFDDFDGGSRQLVNARSAVCADVQWGSLQDYAYLQNYHCTDGNTAQHFFLNP